MAYIVASSVHKQIFRVRVGTVRTFSIRVNSMRLFCTVQFQAGINHCGLLERLPGYIASARRLCALPASCAPTCCGHPQVSTATQSQNGARVRPTDLRSESRSGAQGWPKVGRLAQGWKVGPRLEGWP